MNDSQIIAKFLERSEEAIQETARKYDKLCRHIAANILNDAQDVEECVNDTYLGVWNSIPPNIPEVLSAYLCRIARNCALKKYQYLHTQKRNVECTVSMTELEEFLVSPSFNEDAMASAQLSQEIGNFLKTINAQHRIIFMRRYWYFDSISAIAVQFGMSESNVKSVLFRVRNKLKEHLIQEGFCI